MKALPTVHQVKHIILRKRFVPEQKHFNAKDFSLSKLISLYSNLVAMPTVKILFVFLTFHSKCLSNFKTVTYQITEIWWISYKFIVRLLETL